MPTLKLTDRGVAGLQPTPGKRTEYFDSLVPGLALRVTEKGAKSWTVLYRHRGRLRRLTLGSVAVLSLADARDRARDALSDARGGADPASEKQQAKQAETIGELVDEFVEKYARPRKRSWREDRRILHSEVLPAWKHRAIADIKRRDVRALVDGIAERGAPVMANRVLSCARKMFSFAVDRELIEHNPASRMARPGGVEHSRDRVLSEAEQRQLWAALGDLSPQMGSFFKLRLVTAQRGAEVASMRWQDVDLEGGWWTIPAAVSKNKLAHRVPLCSLALEIVKGLKPLDREPEPAEYVLTGARGRRQRSEVSAAFTISDFRGHDLRRTAASMMAAGGIPRLTIGKVLNHADRGVTAVYDRHGYDTEKRRALAWWDARLIAIVVSGIDTQ
jgi:integrase